MRIILTHCWSQFKYCIVRIISIPQSHQAEACWALSVYQKQSTDSRALQHPRCPLLIWCAQIQRYAFKTMFLSYFVSSQHSPYNRIMAGMCFQIWLLYTTLTYLLNCFSKIPIFILFLELRIETWNKKRSIYYLLHIEKLLGEMLNKLFKYCTREDGNSIKGIN